MRRRYLHLLPVLALAGGFIALVRYMRTHSIALFDTAGPIAEKERNLMFFAFGLSLLVVLPVFAMLLSFAWKYREQNTKATYSPNLDGSRIAETIWWGLPTALILIMAVVAWNSSHALDPYKSLVSAKQPLHVQVVSLDWKWLFIYPDQNIATVNELHVPVGVPVNFTLTSDAPMNSFWIPRLGGQVYTMQGMTTQLHLQADKPGSYRGQSSNISGKGFAGMHFQTIASTQSEFNSWVTQARSSKTELSSNKYKELSRPTENTPVTTYGSVQDGLFNATINKYMQHHETTNMTDTDSSMKMEGI